MFLHARLDRRAATARGRAPKRPEVAKQVILANVRKLRKLVARLEWEPPEDVWVTYGERTYSEEDAGRKDEFLRRVAGSKAWPLAWDLGCNRGRHARIAAEDARYVVAVDAEHGPVELLYRELRAAGDERILPLTVNVADPSPPLGWRGCERLPLHARGRPDLVLALALVHHVTIGNNVPVKEFVGWLAELGGALVVEFPTRDDPMVQKLLAPKRPGLHPDYDVDVFEHHLRDAFDVSYSEWLTSGTRILYYATPRVAVI